ARGRFAREGRQSTDGRAELRKSLGSLIERFGSTYPDLLLVVAGMDAEARATDSARKVLQLGRKLHPQVVAFPRELARLELAAGNRKEAVDLLKSISNKLPPLAAEYWVTVELLVEAGEKARAIGLVGAIRRDEDTAGLVDYLEARLAFADDRWAEAVRLLE